MNAFETRIVMLNNITELHVGSAEGSNLADQAIQRNIHMQIPKIDAATWKGAYLEKQTKAQRENGKGLVSNSDLNLLFLSVYTAFPLYTHITCPSVWNHFVKLKYMNGFVDKECYEKNRIEEYILPDEIYMDKECGDSICISEMFLNISKRSPMINWNMLIDIFKGRYSAMGVVSDETFAFLTKTNVSIVTRNNIKDANVYTIEYLPENCLFYGSMTSFIKIPEGPRISFHKESNLDFQLGADASLGKGFVKLWEIYK